MKQLIKLGIDLMVRVIPVIGDAKDNKDSENGGKGNFQWAPFVISLLRTAGTIAAAWMMK